MTIKPTSEDFDFLKEFQTNRALEKLVPQKPVALKCLLWLFEHKLDFGERNRPLAQTEIEEAILIFEPQHKADGGRVPWTYYNEIVSDLQEFFLRHDEEKNELYFKEYAISFCGLIYRTLKAQFNPSQIKQICIDLCRSLELYETESDFLSWYNIQWTTFKPALGLEIDKLERRLAIAVEKLVANRKLNLDEGKILETLKEVKKQFDEIKLEFEALQEAFGQLDGIKEQLEIRRIGIESEEILVVLGNSIGFIFDKTDQLTIVGRRLDRIVPKVRQIFSNLNKSLFFKKLDGFIDHVVQKSKLERRGMKKVVTLPGEMKAYEILSITPKFLIVEKDRTLLPPVPKPLKQFISDPKKRTVEENRSKEKLVSQAWIGLAIRRMESVLKVQNEITFSPFFMEALHIGNPPNLSLAVPLAFQTLKYFESQEDIAVEITPSKKVKSEKYNVEIWEMIIRKTM